MKMIFRLGLIVIGLIFASQAAFAEVSWTHYYWPNGVYVGAAGAFGYTFFRVNGALNSATIPVLHKNKNKTTTSGFNVCVGFAPKTMPLHFDVFYNYLGRFHYNSSPVFTAPLITYNNLTSDLSSEAIFVNAYYDMPLYNKFWPYIGIGVGQARNKTSLTATAASGSALKVNHTNSNIAMQGTIGFNVKVMKNLLLYGAYRFIDIGKAQWGSWDSTNATLKSEDIFVHQGEFGFKIFFGDQTSSQPPSLLNDTVDR